MRSFIAIAEGGVADKIRVCAGSARFNLVFLILMSFSCSFNLE